MAITANQASRRAITGVAGLLMLLSNLAFAAAEEIPAQVVVRETTDKVLRALRDEGDALTKDPTRLYALIDELVLPRFDFMRMSRWVLGPHWRSANEAQRVEFAKAFQNLLVRTYSRALLEFRDRKVEFLAPRVRAEDEVTVRAQVDQGGGPLIPITYDLALVDGTWKVYDVSIDGVSLVINYRSSFSQEVKKSGIDGLIKRLNDHNAKVEG